MRSISFFLHIKRFIFCISNIYILTLPVNRNFKSSKTENFSSESSFILSVKGVNMVHIITQKCAEAHDWGYSISRILSYNLDDYMCRYLSCSIVTNRIFATTPLHKINLSYGTVLHTSKYLAVSAGLNRIVSVRNSRITADWCYHATFATAKCSAVCSDFPHSLL